MNEMTNQPTPNRKTTRDKAVTCYLKVPCLQERLNKTKQALITAGIPIETKTAHSLRLCLEQTRNSRKMSSREYKRIRPTKYLVCAHNAGLRKAVFLVQTQILPWSDIFQKTVS